MNCFREATCPSANIASPDTRIQRASTRRGRRSHRPARRTTPLDRGRSICREPGLSPGAQNVARCWKISARLLGSVPNVDFSSIPASNASISIPPAASSVTSPSPNEFSPKTSAMNVRSTRFACAWKRKHRARWRSVRMTRGRLSRTSFASESARQYSCAVWASPSLDVSSLRFCFRLPGAARAPAAPSYGFCVGRMEMSLMNDCGAWVSSMATACATSVGCSILVASLCS